MLNANLVQADEMRASHFESSDTSAKRFASFLRSNRREVAETLMSYETYEVAQDEIERTLDLLENLKENQDYFAGRTDRVVSFLPLNQPLYALSCFGIVPSLMAEMVFVRVPTIMTSFFDSLEKTLSLAEHFPNLYVSRQGREEFVKTHSEKVNCEVTGAVRPLTNAVIFTGTMQNADKVRKCFPSETLFIANGSGHNPIVVADDADLELAVQGAMRVQLYNQGQDCAAPNAILVKREYLGEFLDILKSRLKKIKCGSYKDASVQIGPMSQGTSLAEVQEVLLKQKEWLDHDFEGVIRPRSGIIEPAIIVKPLRLGGNYRENFAPIFFIQSYDEDSDLATYFENSKYRHNAMYVTIFGKSHYVSQLEMGHLGLHDITTVIRDADLHADGVERGVKPYGGYGRGASCLSLNGVILAKPTLPQRDICEYVLKGTKLTSPNNFEALQQDNSSCNGSNGNISSCSEVLDISAGEGFLTTPNKPYIERLSEVQKAHIRTFRGLLLKNSEAEINLKDLIGQTFGLVEDPKTLLPTFYATLYNLLIGKERGPRIVNLIRKTDLDTVLKLLDIDGVSD